MEDVIIPYENNKTTNFTCCSIADLYSPHEATGTTAETDTAIATAIANADDPDPPTIADTDVAKETQTLILRAETIATGSERIATADVAIVANGKGTGTVTVARAETLEGTTKTVMAEETEINMMIAAVVAETDEMMAGAVSRKLAVTVPLLHRRSVSLRPT